MRLINVHTLCVEPINLAWDLGTQSYQPAYAILSHTWLDEEVTFDDLSPTNRSFPEPARRRAGWDKIYKSCVQARRDGLSYVWVDTCCIDKSSSAELSEAINSMFRWYRHAAVCYAYLSDVVVAGSGGGGGGGGGGPATGAPSSSLPAPFSPSATLTTLLARSRWFTRGWTLQELVAPRAQNFYDASWTLLGTKEDLVEVIADITRIPPLVLVEPSTTSLAQFTVAQKMAWAARRVTTREEDMSYCLLGIFDINLPLLYGEGGERAFLRLQEEIVRRYDDDSLFAWRIDEERHGRGGGLLATHPACFDGCQNILTLPADPFADFLHGLQLQLSPIQVTNRGWKVHRTTWQEGYWLMMPLRCWDAKRQPGPGQSIVSITLTEHDATAAALAGGAAGGGAGQYVRLDWMTVPVADLLEKRRCEERELFLMPANPPAHHATAAAGLGWLTTTSRDVWIRSLPERCVVHKIETSAPARASVSAKTRLVKGLDEGQWVAFTLRCSAGPAPTPTGNTPVTPTHPPMRDLYVALFVFSRSLAERPLHVLASGPDAAAALAQGHASLVDAAGNPGQHQQATCDGPLDTSLHALLDAGEKADAGGGGGGGGGKRYIIDVFAMGNNKGEKVWDGSPVMDQGESARGSLRGSLNMGGSFSGSNSMSLGGSLSGSMSFAPDDGGGGGGLSVAGITPRGRTRDRSRLGRVGTGFGSGFGFDGRSHSRVGSFDASAGFGGPASGQNSATTTPGATTPVTATTANIVGYPDTAGGASADGSAFAVRPRLGSGAASSLWQRRRRRSASVSISPSRVVVVDVDEEERMRREEEEDGEGAQQQQVRRDSDESEYYSRAGEGGGALEDLDEEELSPRGRRM